jgi:hypothetical protein
MVRQLLDIANDCLRGFRTQDARRAHVWRNWFQLFRRPQVREARGLELLRKWLSPEQLAQYDSKGYFDVTGCDSGKRYRICHGTAMNVYEIDLAGNPRNGWCFVPNAPLVAGDVMLAQKIALETDERGALVVAKNFMPSASAFRQHCSPIQAR